MAFIDTSYFINDINLTAQQLGNIDSYIESYEKEILVGLLGYPLYKLLIADLVDGEPQSDRFVKLMDGDDLSFETYQGNTVDCEWVGLRESSLKQSLISYYVFFKYMNYNNTQITTVGHKKTKAENSESVDIRGRLVDAWNNMQNWYGSTFDHIGKNELYLNQDNYLHSNPNPSAFNYLLANKETYPEWVFKPLDKMNYLGI